MRKPVGKPPYHRTHVEGTGKPPGCKLIRLSADIEDGIICRISIRGDFFASPEEGFERAEARLRGVPAADAGRIFDFFLKEEGVEAAGIDGSALAEVLNTGLQKNRG
ncbi:MAG: hypothetical protein LBP60_02770 [Spirochaetaceae bacterium]|jgi:hypothetical protein|nr:hypothetical protein [Spirochaetaceae bacterium]